MRIVVCTNLGQGDKRFTVSAQTVRACGSASFTAGWSSVFFKGTDKLYF